MRHVITGSAHGKGISADATANSISALALYSIRSYLRLDFAEVLEALLDAAAEPADDRLGLAGQEGVLGSEGGDEIRLFPSRATTRRSRDFSVQ